LPKNGKPVLAKGPVFFSAVSKTRRAPLKIGIKRTLLKGAGGGLDTFELFDKI